MPDVPRPFTAYLRVYEPLSAINAELAESLTRVLRTGHLVRSEAGGREREMWLRSQLSVPVRMLPGESAGGRELPRSSRDVLLLASADLPVSQTATVGPEPLVCPLDVLPRSAAALVGFLSTAHPVLREAVLNDSVERVRGRAAGILDEQTPTAVHCVSTTWTVPLPWFVMVDPAERRVVVATRNDPAREVSWRVPMADARSRVARAHELAVRTFGDQGPSRVLQDTADWLANFHEHSVVELDYGGLVQLLDDTELVEDTSAADVNAVVEALETGDSDAVKASFQRLREFWGSLAMRERYN